MKNLLVIILSMSFIFSVYADDTQEDIFGEMEVNLIELCDIEGNSQAKIEDTTPEQTGIEIDSCTLKDKLKEEETSEPYSITKKDKKGRVWKLNFYFGFAKTSYGRTSLRLRSSDINATISDFEFRERTSADFYNPSNWQQPMDALRWIDEPTNQFILELEYGDHVFQINAFHPKYLEQNGQYKPVRGTVNGEYVDRGMDIDTELGITEFRNTYQQMDWQIGYGRRFVLINQGKFNVTYRPYVNLGFTTGQHVDVTVNNPVAETTEQTFTDKSGFYGMNGSIGNRVSLQYGRASLFVDQKFTFSHLEHQFRDGKASYNMMYIPVTFGLGIRLAGKKK